MHYNQILSFLNSEKKLNQKAESSIRKHFHFIQVKKKDILLHAYTVCDKIFFINKGVLRAYYINDKGTMITRTIASENRFLTNMISFINFAKNIETFECLEDADLLYINRKELTELLDISPVIRARYCDLLEQCNAIQIKHIHFITNSEVTDKIQYLKSNFPEIVGRVNDRILASFLGISRETIVRHKALLYWALWFRSHFFKKWSESQENKIHINTFDFIFCNLINIQ